MGYVNYVLNQILLLVVALIFFETSDYNLSLNILCEKCNQEIDKIKYYCKYCYENGQFTNPHITLEEMEERVKSKMEEMKMDADTISLAVSSLPNLKRWRKIEKAQL